MKNLVACFVLLLAVSQSTFSAEAASSRVAPEWFLQEIATLTAASGRWITDNSEYKSEQEPYDAYGTEWTSSFGGTSMSGRLFGIQDGKETANFWEFRQYWHPAHGVAVLEQFGWGGTVGVGTAWQEGATTKSDQTFFTADGRTNRTGHISEFPDQDTHVTQSFDIENNVWIARRSYTWRRTGELDE